MDYLGLEAALEPTEHAIVEHLRPRFFEMLPDLPGIQSPEQQEKNKISRALAAFAVAQFADLHDVAAVAAVTDGFDDNGLDAVCYTGDEGQPLFIVQSKAGAAPNEAETLKFANGIRALVSRQWDRFHAGFAKLAQDVDDALDAGVSIHACIVYGSGSLGTHAKRVMDDLAAEINRVEPKFTWSEMGAKEIGQAMAAQHAREPVTAVVTLRGWGLRSDGVRVFYGRVAAGELADLLDTTGPRLLERNIRHYLGRQSINSAIEMAAATSPEDFLCFNNGVAIVCRSVGLPTGASTSEVRLTLRDCSIVNGAQTVGSVLESKRAGRLTGQPEVLLTIVETGDHAALASNITRYRNSQNAVRQWDFAALDPNQERIRRELAMLGIEYHYRPSSERSAGSGITIDRAARALACYSGNLALVATAKAEPWRLMGPDTSEYGTLFTASTTGAQVARAVEIHDYLAGVLVSSEAAETSSQRRLFYRHSVHFLVAMTVRKEGEVARAKRLGLTDDDKLRLSRVALEIAEAALTVAQRRLLTYQGALALFKSRVSVEELSRGLTAAVSASVLKGTEGQAIE